LSTTGEQNVVLHSQIVTYAVEDRRGVQHHAYVATAPTARQIKRRTMQEMSRILQVPMLQTTLTSKIFRTRWQVPFMLQQKDEKERTTG